MGTLNNTNKLPECPTYIAHPQAVKFREFWIRWHKHWDENNYTDVITDVMTIKRYDDDIHVVEIAALAAKDAEIAKLKGDLSHYELIIASKSTSIDLLKNELDEKDAVLDELADLMEEVRSGNYKPDTFTLQPYEKVLQKYRKSEG